MNYYGANELAASFRTVRKNTIIIANEIDEKDYGFRAAPEARSVAELLTHISHGTRAPLHIHSVARLSTLEGFDFMSFFGKMMEEEKHPEPKQAIIANLTESGDLFAKFLEQTSEDFLAERVAFPPHMPTPSKSRFEMLLAAKEHEMHHRGQLMLVERMLGQVPHLTRDMQAFITAQWPANRPDVTAR